MPITSAATSMDVASTRTRRRSSSWSQLVLQIAVLALLMCSRFGTSYSLPANVVDQYHFDELSKRSVDDRQDFTSMCQNTYLTERRVLCNLVQPQREHKRLVRRSGDASSLSAFQRLVTRLRQYQTARDQVEQELTRLRSMGVVDENNQVVRIPDDMAAMMERVG